MKTWNTPSVTVCTAAELQETIHAKASCIPDPIPIKQFVTCCEVGDRAYVVEKTQISSNTWRYRWFYVTCTSAYGGYWGWKWIQKDTGEQAIWGHGSQGWEQIGDWY